MPELTKLKSNAGIGNAFMDTLWRLILGVGNQIMLIRHNLIAAPAFHHLEIIIGQPQ
jgi:hypothetical protein